MYMYTLIHLSPTCTQFSYDLTETGLRRLQPLESLEPESRGSDSARRTRTQKFIVELHEFAREVTEVRIQYNSEFKEILIHVSFKT